MPEERRASKRIVANIGAAILDSASSMYLGKGKIIDISVGGVRLEASAKLEIGDKIVVNFILQKRDYMSRTGLSVTGEIEAVWKTPKGKINIYGLKFVRLSVIDKERIRDFINFKIREGETFI